MTDMTDLEALIKSRYEITWNEELKMYECDTDDVVFGSRELSDVIRFHSNIVKLEQKKAGESPETGEAK